MRNKIKIIGLAIVLFSSITMQSKEASWLKDDNKPLTKLTFEKVKQGAVLVIKDNNGLTLYKEAIKKSGVYSRDFDLTLLPDGNYYFELDKQLEIKVIPFEVVSSVVTFIKEKQTTINKPSVVVKEDRILVSRLSMNEKPLDIKIYYEGSDLIHTEKIEGQQSQKRIYDLSKSIRGNYQMILEAEGRKFVKNIVL